MGQIVEYARHRTLVVARFRLSDLLTEVLTLLRQPLQVKTSFGPYELPSVSRLFADRSRSDRTSAPDRHRSLNRSLSQRGDWGHPKRITDMLDRIGKQPAFTLYRDHKRGAKSLDRIGQQAFTPEPLPFIYQG